MIWHQKMWNCIIKCSQQTWINFGFVFVNFHKNYVCYLVLNFFYSFVRMFKKNLRHSCQTPTNLDLYPPMEKNQLKRVNAKFQVEVGYWASRNGLQDYKMYGIIIKIFTPKFLNNLPQPIRNNPWRMHPINQNYKMRFQKQCDYLLGFQSERKCCLKDTFLQKNWPKNVFDSKNDVYESPRFMYKKKIDSIV